MKKTAFFSAHALKHSAKAFALVSFASLLLVSCDKDDDDHYDPKHPPATPAASVLAAAGDSATIIGTINQFRTLLGDPLNTSPDQIGGRREVNWDAVPPAFTNQNNFPFDFFNNTDAAAPAGRKRGLVLNNGSIFRVDTTEFAEIDPSYAAQFETFSKKRLFVTASSNVTGVTFKVPGAATDATVRGFGVVFSDVDSDNSTYIEFYNGTKKLGAFKVPAHPASGNFSFLGVKFNEAKITSLKIISGNGALGAGIKDVSDGGNKDLVVMDDFFYDEPVAK